MDTFRHKAGHRNAQARECNKAADVACNVCLGLQHDVRHIDIRSIADAPGTGAHLQLYSDCDFKAGRGAPARSSLLFPSTSGRSVWQNWLGQGVHS
eukprot:7825127-Pyramimonas_sp.AAC.1